MLQKQHFRFVDVSDPTHDGLIHHDFTNRSRSLSFEPSYSLFNIEFLGPSDQVPVAEDSYCDEIPWP